MKQFVAGSATTISSMWLVKRVDGTVLAFTDHDVDLTFDLEAWLTAAGISVTPWILGTGSQTYKAASGYTPSDVATSGALNVDNMEIHGVLVSPSITEADLNAGLWDAADICNFQVNWNAPGLLALTSITRSGSTATATAAAVHGLSANYGPFLVTIYGAAESAYNGTHSVTPTTTTKFTFTVSGTPATPATGSLFYQVIYGAIIERIGKLGEVTIERGAFKAELRGLMQAYTRSIGEIMSPSCRADLGDARCTVDLTPFTVTSTITSVNPDGVTLYDTARTEPGPTGELAISTISIADPGRVFLGTTVPWADGFPVTIGGVLGPTIVNTDTVVRNPSGSHFDLPISLVGQPAYISGGFVWPLGATSGYFDGGLITFTSGLNTGLSMEVKNYVPGVIVMQLPMPYTVAPGDAYTMHAGCDKSLATCRDRFNNVVNMRAEPYLPGVDKLVQVGRHG